MDKIPKGWHLCDGTNGTPDLTNRFLEGVTTDVNQFKEAGLPNITGAFSADQYAQDFRKMVQQGAFKFVRWSAEGDAGTGNGDVATFSFDASRSNAIYGKSDTVQPNSYTVYYIMRIS